MSGKKRKIFLENGIVYEFWGKVGGDFLDIESRAGPQNSRTKKPPCYAPKNISSIKMLATNRKKVFFTVRSGKKNKFYRENGRFMDCCRGFCMGKIFSGTK